MQWSDGTPLGGVKILDLCAIISGSFATTQLGDLGADILKLEKPLFDDEARTYGPPFLGGKVPISFRSTAISVVTPWT